MFQLLFNKFFTTKGRGSRKEYVIKFLLILFFGITWDYTKKYTNNKIIEFFYVFFLGASLIMMVFQYIPLSIRRLHDLNASGWYVLLTFAPFGQFLILWLMFKKGTEGVNRYGEPPQY
jgi:uncharacterized membrane protein YhaH (DUF805 family)